MSTSHGRISFLPGKFTTVVTAPHDASTCQARSPRHCSAACAMRTGDTRVGGERLHCDATVAALASVDLCAPHQPLRVRSTQRAKSTHQVSNRRGGAAAGQRARGTCTSAQVRKHSAQAHERTSERSHTGRSGMLLVSSATASVWHHLAPDATSRECADCSAAHATVAAARAWTYSTRR
jgi:hypothetical protein